MFLPGQLFINDNIEKFCFINLIYNFIIDSNINRSRNVLFVGEQYDESLKHSMKTLLLLAIVIHVLVHYR